MRLVPILVCLASVPLSAQSESSTPLEFGFVGLHSQDTAGYGTWAAGSNFKAGFDGGFRFIPYLGADQPTNQPFAWRTESVRIGSTELVSGPRAERIVSSSRYEYSLGGAIEAYDIDAEGVEQTFLIEAAPDHGGTLEVVGVVDTPLHAAPREATHGAVHLRDQTGKVVIEYGAATAIDADGESVPMTTSWDGERIRLALDAAHVARLRFPLLVDPVILSTSFTLAIGMTSVCATDRSQCWVSHTRIASASDHDLYVNEFGADWSNRTTAFVEVSASYSIVHVSSTTADGGAAFAFDRRYSNRTEIGTRISFGPSTTLTAVVGEHLRSPDVAAALGPLRYCIVYDRVAAGTSTIRGAIVGPSSSLPILVSAPFSAALATTGTAVQPQVVYRASGLAQTWVVCWAVSDSTTSSIRARGASLGGSVDPLTQRLLTSTSSIYHEPRMAGDRDLMMLTYRRGPRNIGSNSIRAAKFIPNSTGTWQLVVDRSIASGRTYANGRVAFDHSTESHWMASYTVHTGALTQEVQFARLGSAARATNTIVPASGDRPFASSVTYGERDQSSSSPPGQFLGVWADQSSSNRLMGESLPYPPGAYSPLLILGTPDCGGTDEIAGFYAPSLVGHAGYQALLLETTTIAGLMIGVAPLAVPLDVIGMTGCVLAVDPIATIPAVISSPGAMPRVYWSIPDQPALFGSHVLAQWIWADPTANALGLVTSNRVRLGLW